MCVEFRSARSPSAKNLILNDLTPKNKHMYHFYKELKQYQKLQISEPRGGGKSLVFRLVRFLGRKPTCKGYEKTFQRYRAGDGASLLKKCNC